ncbi:MAG: hypothetical protein IKU14_05895, partial [Rhodocyclaceae bacterium]|nr:hypothetical protein [Rhodocyclaceae bacterium]
SFNVKRTSLQNPLTVLFPSGVCPAVRAQPRGGAGAPTSLPGIHRKSPKFVDNSAQGIGIALRAAALSQIETNVDRRIWVYPNTPSLRR